ncbi:MAG: hypothetical protein U9R75_09020, partial [Candidatus Thermoplasmatota archaeon]|nr:hypothetical protein [Candidatus Thermoplasmatota archaeon]
MRGYKLCEEEKRRPSNNYVQILELPDILSPDWKNTSLEIEYERREPDLRSSNPCGLCAVTSSAKRRNADLPTTTFKSLNSRIFY